MALLKSRKLRHQPAYLLADAHDLYTQAHGQYVAASAAFGDEANLWADHIRDLRAQLSEAEDEREQNLVLAETSRDIAEHLEKL